MKILKLALFTFIPMFTFQALSRAQEFRFFRIRGPVASKITSISANGNLTWTNTATNGVFTIQTTPSLSPANWRDYIQVPSTNSMTTIQIFDPNTPRAMAFIPAGSFTMGNCMNSGEDGDPEELPLHTVYVSKFNIDKYEVTNGLWDEVYSWAITHGYSFEDTGVFQRKTDPYPAAHMTWYEAVKWCNARSEKEGRTPAYYTDIGQTIVYRTGELDVANDWVKWNTGYRLPTEAEWEKAARGGSSGHRFSWSDTDEITHSRANYYALGTNYYVYDTSPTLGYHPDFQTDPDPKTSPAGYFAANNYGLYDMVGNVYERCWDWWDHYSTASQIDPRGPASGSYGRVFRGGAWNEQVYFCRISGRFLGDLRGVGKGFRSVLPPG